MNLSKAVNKCMKINPYNINNGMKNTSNPSFGGVVSSVKTVASNVAAKNSDIFVNITKRVGEYVNSPEQKLITTILALMFQPIIDLSFAEEDQKVDSAIKTTSKLVAGGITGVSIRALTIKLAEFLIAPNNSDELGAVRAKIKKIFTPQEAVKLIDENKIEYANRKLLDYSKTIGNIMAVAIMILYTNAHVDVPLTSALRDLITGIVKEDKSFVKSLTDVVNDRKQQREEQKKLPKDVGFLDKIKSKISNFFSKEKKEVK